MVKFYFSAFADEAGASIDEQIAALKRNNISYIEPRGIDGQCVIFKTDDELKEIRRKLDENKIKVSSIGSPIGKYNITDDFDTHLVDFRKAINAAKILGTKNIRMFSFFVPEGETAKYRDEVIRRLSVMLEEAEKEGITLCHENEAKIYGQNVAEVKDLLEALPSLKGIFDPANYLLTNNSPVAGIDATLPHLEYMHIKDALEYEKMIVPAGEGEGLIGEAIVKANDYFEDKTILLTLEPHLARFVGYSDLDSRTLKGKHSFANTNDSFDFAVKALEKVMTQHGFENNSDNSWTMRNFEKVRFGIVGMGNQGKLYAKHLTENKIRNGVLGAMCDNNPAALDKAKELYGEGYAYFADAEEMMKSGLIDVVLVEVPHYQHSDIAIMAMNNGLHAVVDKPAGVHTKQVKEMLERHKTSDKLLGIMFNQRTNPCFKKMRQMIADGELGEIKRTNWIITTWYRSQDYYDSGSWRGTWDGEGGGVLYNQAPHQLDLYQWIIGMMPTKVHSFCHYGKWHNIEVEDDVTTYMEFPNGATGVFVTTTADTPGTNRFEITGSKGTLVFQSNTLTFTKLEEDEREFCFKPDVGFSVPKSATSKINIYKPMYEQHVAILNNVANTILGIEDLYAPAEDGICGVELANAMHMSSWENATIELPTDSEKFYEKLMVKVENAKNRAK
ncbi:MAG: hypothetical protein E7587_04670 [Ruminococcaceae bacterium]|nr:hypothetical protein [Oscillospiraceae bacterium]